MKEVIDPQINANEDRLTMLVKAVDKKMRNQDVSFNQTKQIEEYQKYTSYVIRCAQQIIRHPEKSEILKEELCDFLQKKLDALEKTIPVTEARIFQNLDEVKVASSPPVVSGIEALLRVDLWSKESYSGVAIFQHQAKNDSKNFIEHSISSPGDISLLPWKEAQEIINLFGFTSAKLHLLFASHTTNQDKPWESSFTLKASDIAKDLGWDDHKSKSKQLLEIAQTAFALDCLLVRTVWIEGRNKKGGIDASTPTGRMWNITITPHGEMNLDKKVEEPTEIYLTIQPGGWTQHFLNKAGNKSREALYQFGYMSRQVLQLSGSSHNELALRLAIHLTLESRYHHSGEYRIQTLLEAVLPHPEIEASRNIRRKGYDLKQRWDNSLELLKSIGWKIYYDEQSYPQWLRPGSKERQPKGYLDKLLNAKITIKPTSTIQQKLARVKKARKSQPSTIASPRLTGIAIKSARQAKGWTQCKLAGTLGISKQLISHVESGRRSVSPELAAHIRRALDIP